MSEPTLNRRDVIHLGVAAMGGLLAGTLAGCTSKPTGGGKPDAGKMPSAGAEKTSLLLNDPHVCRGINTCKNKGKKGTTNECAGQPSCATVASHDCHGMKNSKGHGGLGC